MHRDNMKSKPIYRSSNLVNRKFSSETPKKRITKPKRTLLQFLNKAIDHQFSRKNGEMTTSQFVIHK